MIERNDPIPAGVYWIDVFEPAQLAFRKWLRENAGTVRVRKTTSHPARNGYPAREWFLFEIKAATPRWPNEARIGLPTVAPKGTATEETDTVRRPAPETTAEYWSRELGELGIGGPPSRINWFLIGAASAAAVWWWRRGRERDRSS